MGRPTSGTYLLRTLLGGCGLNRSLPRPACNPVLWLTPRQSPSRHEALGVGVVCKLLHQEVHLAAEFGHLLRVRSHQGAERAKDLSTLATVLSMTFTHLSLGDTHMGVVTGIASNTGLGWEFEPRRSTTQTRNPLLHILNGWAAILLDHLFPKQQRSSIRWTAEAVKPGVHQAHAWPRLAGAILAPPGSPLLLPFPTAGGAGGLWADD